MHKRIKILDSSKPKGEPHICYYCGRPADAIDHVVPIAMLRQLACIEDLKLTKKILKNRALKVWACRECNALLSDSIQATLEERRQYLKIKLLRRYRNILAAPDWTEKELNELGPTLRRAIEALQKAKKAIKTRLEWPDDYKTMGEGEF